MIVKLWTFEWENIFYAAKLGSTNLGRPYDTFLQRLTTRLIKLIIVKLVLNSKDI